jgi:endonuclease/exonuclease/phosphatase family metal-dependent hydrolase
MKAPRLRGLFACAMALAAVVILVACAQAPARTETQTESTITDALDVVTLNLWHDKQDWPGRQDLIVRELEQRKPDVILLQEVLQDPGLVNQAESLAGRLGYQYRFYSVDPEGQAHRYGNAILTRHPIRASEVVKLQPLDDYRVAGWARIDIDGRPLNIYVTHLHYKLEGGAIRTRQIADLLAFIERTGDQGPSIVGGDFNTGDGTPELAALSPRFSSAYRAAHPDQEVDAPAHTTLNPHMGHPPQRIDHVFFQRDAFQVSEARILFGQPAAGGAWASDHFGLWVRLTSVESNKGR